MRVARMSGRRQVLRASCVLASAFVGWSTVACAADPDPLQSLRFLEGSWSAKANGAGGAAAIGSYVFRRELQGHVLARHSTTEGCKGPDDFDCAHRDLLYVFQDALGQPLKAVYFDNEGHVLHYLVDTSAPNAVVFTTEPAPGPRFRLTYELKGSVMQGKFQMQAPGQDGWMSYLEWSGASE